MLSQNLVNNSSLENYTNCPYQLEIGSLNYISYANGWDSYQYSCDYFNSCSDSSVFVPCSIPKNHYGYQFPSTGNAYAGFSAFQDVASYTNVREGVLASLSDTLEIGQKYYCSYKLNLAEYSAWSCNNVGLLFHVNFVRRSSLSQENRSHVFTINRDVYQFSYRCTTKYQWLDFQMLVFRNDRNSSRTFAIDQYLGG